VNLKKVNPRVIYKTGGGRPKSILDLKKTFPFPEGAATPRPSGRKDTGIKPEKKGATTRKSETDMQKYYADLGRKDKGRGKGRGGRKIGVASRERGAREMGTKKAGGRTGGRKGGELVRVVKPVKNDGSSEYTDVRRSGPGREH